MVEQIWRQEHDSGGFAVNGEMSDTHWAKQMLLYRELYPDLRPVAQEELLPKSFVLDALQSMGREQSSYDAT